MIKTNLKMISRSTGVFGGRVAGHAVGVVVEFAAE
jgi:hypothetical protein